VVDSVWYGGENEPAEMWDYDEFGDEFGEGEFSDDEDWEADAANYGIYDYDNEDFIGVDSDKSRCKAAMTMVAEHQ
jgi:hypothetical protein